jgi:hypothetical protein
MQMITGNSSAVAAYDDDDSSLKSRYERIERQKHEREALQLHAASVSEKATSSENRQNR